MAKTQTHIKEINALSELERVGWKYDPKGDNEVSCLCPVHEDNAPSVSLNIEKNVWICQACKASGDIISLLAYILKQDRKLVFLELSQRYNLKVVKTINPETIETYHEKIWEAGPLLQALYDRGLTDELIRDARLGYHNGRIAIPVYDNRGRVINIRRYLPGAPGNEKFRNIKGYQTSALYLVEQLKYSTICIFGGEMKALVMRGHFNKLDIGVLAPTLGEGGWDFKFNDLMKDKHIYICMDIDVHGRNAAKKLAEKLQFTAASLRILTVPLDPQLYPKGDINDWIASGVTDEDIKDFVASAEKYSSPDATEEADLELVEVDLTDCSAPENLGKRIKCEAIVSATDVTPYIIPKKVSCNCSKDQNSCYQCPIKVKTFDDKGRIEVSIPSASLGILSMVNKPDNVQKEAIQKSLRIPKCKSVSFSVTEWYNIYDVRLIPQLSVDSSSSENVVHPAFIVDNKVKLNTPYNFYGRVYPNPRNQQSVMLLDGMEDSFDSLDSFDPTENELKLLEVFQPVDNTVESIDKKLNEIYSDLETNVTRIFHRRDLHLILDFTYFSCLYFHFDSQIQKGWTNTLIIGDSSQGKSEASLKLMEHYRAGVRHDCKNATTAGLLGGTQQLGNRWFVSWGTIPMHDRRLVLMEEIKGAPQEVLGRLTDMRSSGIAELTKIERRKTNARTRIAMISNPRSGRPISSYNFGIEAIHELIGGLEDIRRFDTSLILSADQIDPKQLNTLISERPTVEHKFTAELSKLLVLWSWTRTHQQIHLSKETTKKCLDRANDLCSMFSEAIPLCDRGTMKHKLARLSIALAQRLFSTGADLFTVRVLPSHVEYVYKWLKRIYEDPVFGYKDFSSAQIFANKVLDPAIIIKQIKNTKFPSDLVEQLLHKKEITIIDICDWCEIDRETAQKLLSLLVRKHAIYRIKRFYVKTSEFIVLLKNMKEKGNFNVPESEEF